MPRDQEPIDSEQNSELWERGVALLTREYYLLPVERRDELGTLLADVGHCKDELLALSDAADGAAICAACGGDCCRVGRYHPTSLDLLACIAREEFPLAPDFASGACPFLGPAGCRIAPSRRPFPCVSFICEQIEARLSGDAVARLHQVEEEVRLLREQAARRFGRHLARSFLLEMERFERDSVPFPPLTNDGG